MPFRSVEFVKGQEDRFCAEGRAFEALVGGHLDPVLNPYGFTITPQGGFGVAPPDHKLVSYSVVYETSPEEFARRFPELDARSHGDVPCVDLWIHQDPRTGQITATIEGANLIPLLREIDRTHGRRPLRAAAEEPADQLRLMARALHHALSHFKAS